MASIKLNTTSEHDDFSVFSSEIENLSLDRLYILREKLWFEINHRKAIRNHDSEFKGIDIWKNRLKLVLTRINRLESVPNETGLLKETMKAICYCEKYNFSFLDCPGGIMQKKFPTVGYNIQDLKRKAADVFFNSGMKERRKICAPFFKSERLTREQVENAYKYYKCDNCGTLNPSTFYPCSKCGHYLY